MNIIGYKSPFKKSSPMRMDPATMVLLTAAPGIIKGIGSLFGRSERMSEQRRANKMYDDAKKAFEDIKFTNPYENLTNPYTGLKNPYAGLQNPYAENIYEDLGVNTQAADYLREQQQQSQANILQQFRGVAGGAGAAGLAQALANLSDKQAREASAKIAEQEAENKKLRLKGEQQRRVGQFELDKLRREGGFDIEKLQRSTDFAIDQAQIQGELFRQQQEMSRLEALYGLGIDRKMAADQARADSRSQGYEALGDIISSVGSLYMPKGALYRE
tara:strand:- start:596 stop:1414 length:819 start_codon:yes stop_codon:yes gene_type:complete